MAEEKRKYTKRSDYWKKFKSKESQNPSIEDLAAGHHAQASEYAPKMVGESLYETQASRSTRPTSTQRSQSRTNAVTQQYTKNRFKNIDDGLLPFHYSADGVDASDAIELVQKAYFNIPAVRSTIDLLADFADAEVYLEGGSKKSRDLIEAWLKRIKINDLKGQYFREYYRSSNFFTHRMDGKLKSKNSRKLYETYGAANTDFKIPIRYLVLNPTDITAKGSLSFADHEYAKVLTPFEVARLRNPKTKHEQEMYDALPEETKKLIQKKSHTSSEQIHIKLDSDFLHTVFAKKQDYEPLSIPYIFSVLDDVNKKMELKKIDQAIARSIENVVLLVTMGAEPEKGGINPKAIDAMQEIFQNQSVGRVLVADYTTKADFVIPDLKKVMGKEKYEVLNQDIQEGLQNVLIGETKYSDGSLKMKIFMTRLEESRQKFIDEFLQPEIKRVCKGLGLKNYPTVRFVKTDTLDNSDLTKLATRMMELGILTPDQGMDVLHKGEFPTSDELNDAQEKFKEDREKGHYLPMVNSVSVYEGEEGEGKPKEQPMAQSAPKAAVKKAKEGKPANPKNPTPSGGRPAGQSNASISKKALVEATTAVSEFEGRAYREFALKYGLDELTADKKESVGEICGAIIVAKEHGEWDAALAEVVENLDALSDLDVKPDVLEFGSQHGLSDVGAAILYHSTKISV